MAPKRKASPPLPLAFLYQKHPVEGTPRQYEPPSSNRFSVASTWEGGGQTPFLRSPEATYRTVGPLTHTPRDVSHPAGKEPRLPHVYPSRRARLVDGQPCVEAQLGTLISKDIINAKKYGNALPPLKERCVDMRSEGIDFDTMKLIDAIPARSALEIAGVPVHSFDPMFIEEIVEYQLEHPIPPRVLQKFPNYDNFPLLLTRLEVPKHEPNITNLPDAMHLRGHNENMLENKYKKIMCKGAHVREAYMYVPNFGRVQVMLSDYPDGTSYPLVTLPKMTPHDIIDVLDRQKRLAQRTWVYYFRQFLHRISCGLF